MKKGNFLAIMQDIKEEGDELAQRRKELCQCGSAGDLSLVDQMGSKLENAPLSFLLAESKINPKVSVA